MLERLGVIGVLAAAVSLAGCQESPLEPTDQARRPDPVVLSTAPDPLYAVPSTGVTFVADGEEREYAYRVSFDLILRAHRDNEIGVMLTSDSIVLQQLETVDPESAGGVVDRETYRFEARSGQDKILAGEETSREYDVWYTLPNGGREALIAVSLDFIDDNETPFSQVRQVAVEPLPEP